MNLNKFVEEDFMRQFEENSFATTHPTRNRHS